MNRFLAKKRGKEGAPTPRPSLDSEPSGPFRMFGKNKTTPDEEPKAEVDLSNALPSSDDFRTSLLMTGLSARFSMLREQDDPNTKVGKASDDSVLFPKSQSKLSDFGLDGGLRELSGIQSLRSSQIHDLDILASEDAVSGSSIMSRGKPTDGNILFGGRQKIYRIPANGPGVAKNDGMPGRALYGDDVAVSGFQKWKQAEKEKERERGKEKEKERENGKGMEMEKMEMEMNMEMKMEKKQDEKGKHFGGGIVKGNSGEFETRPSFSRRGTSSTIYTTPSSTPSATPSATPLATGRGSIVGNSPFLAQRTTSVRELVSASASSSASASPIASTTERSVTKTRRLYEQGLNRELVDQQSTAVSRMNSLSQVRAFGAPTPEVQTPTSGSLSERRQALAKAGAPTLRSFGPGSLADANRGLGTNPPLTPPISESDEQTPTLRASSNGSAVTAQHSVPRDIQTMSFFDDSDASPVLNQAPGTSQTPQVSVERPDDDDHPAFRKAGPPTPLPLAPRAPGSLAPESEDSPTLGPNSGLSSMVRAHLRTESLASSVCDNGQETAGEPTGGSGEPASSSGQQTASSRSPSRVGEERDKEQDDFARHLADGARRIREKLTTYVDADPERATPLPSSPVETSKELNPPRPSLGLLRSKSSRGSLFDRENREQNLARSLKTAISPTSVTAALPSPRKLFGEWDDARGGAAAKDQGGDEAGDDNVSLGLRAFRQARRELQKVKEMESQQRPQAGPMRPLALRAMSYDTGGGAVPYSRVTREEGVVGGSPLPLGSRPGSRAPSERERSGSETSNSDRATRMHSGIGSVAEDQHPSSPSGARRQGYMANGGRSGGHNGAGLPMTVSTPNLPAPTVAPPLPPLNPRRKNGPRGEEDSPLTSPRMPGGFPRGDDGSDEETAAEQRRQKLRRAASEGASLHGRARNSPPRGGRPPPLPQGHPQGGVHHGRLHGGMI